MDDQIKAFSPTDPFGRAIEIGEANTEISSVILVQDELRKWIRDGIRPSAFTINFLQSIVDRNVFVFDKELIERFKNATGLTHYIACIGAKNDGATIVFAGCEKVEDTGTNFRINAVRPSSSPSKPVSEHPQTRVSASIGDPFLHGPEKNYSLQ